MQADTRAGVDALAYLHSQDPQIVHRDVKPGNILILHHRPGDIFIKFADFGISREGDTLKTICGTYVYLAPEVYKAASIGKRGLSLSTPLYTALVDIWSLGVVIARLLCGLPKLEKDQVMGVDWCDSIREKVKFALQQGLAGAGGRRRRRRRQDLLSFVLESMLCIEPGVRRTALECYKETLLFLDDDDVPESHPGGAGNHHHSNGVDADDSEASTILAGKKGGGSSLSSLSSMSRYISDDELGGRRPRLQESSCDAPSPETAVAAVPLYDSSFGEDASSSALTAVLITARDDSVEQQHQQQEEEEGWESEEGSESLVRAPCEESLDRDRSSENPIREALFRALGDMARGGRGQGDGSVKTPVLSVKRSVAAR